MLVQTLDFSSRPFKPTFFWLAAHRNQNELVRASVFTARDKQCCWDMSINDMFSYWHHTEPGVEKTSWNWVFWLIWQLIHSTTWWARPTNMVTKTQHGAAKILTKPKPLGDVMAVASICYKWLVLWFFLCNPQCVGDCWRAAMWQQTHHSWKKWRRKLFFPPLAPFLAPL